MANRPGMATVAGAAGCHRAVGRRGGRGAQDQPAEDKLPWNRRQRSDDQKRCPDEQKEPSVGKLNRDRCRDDTQRADQFHSRWESVNRAAHAAVTIEEIVAHSFYYRCGGEV